MNKVFGAILPNTKLFGGVRRFFELGNILVDQGHSFVIFSPEGIYPDWFNFKGEVKTLIDVPRYTFTMLFITELNYLDLLLKSSSEHKVIYHVGPRARLDKALKFPALKIFVNSTNMYLHDKAKYGIEGVKAYGGVRLERKRQYDWNESFTPENPFVVMAFGRLSRKGKGTRLVVKACERLYRSGFPVKLLLYDTPIDEHSETLINNFKTTVPFDFAVRHPIDQNESLFKRAHVFVSAEKKGGWSNSAAEALANGIPLIATDTGTKDFLIDGVTGVKVWRNSWSIQWAIKRLLKNKEMRSRISSEGWQKIKEYSWAKLAKEIEHYAMTSSSDLPV